MVNYCSITHLRHVVTRLRCCDLLLRSSQESLFIDFSNKLNLNFLTREIDFNIGLKSSDADTVMVLRGSSPYPPTVQCKD